VPSTSYCGYRHPSDLEISFLFSDSGRGKLNYGHSWRAGTVNVYINNKEIGAIKARGSSTISFDYSSGDVLQIKELSASVINIHSLCLGGALPDGNSEPATNCVTAAGQDRSVYLRLCSGKTPAPSTAAQYWHDQRHEVFDCVEVHSNITAPTTSAIKTSALADKATIECMAACQSADDECNY
jgi:hypothetical protein